MAKHAIVLTPRKQMTEAIEPPAKRRAAIADQVEAYLAGGGEIEVIARGVQADQGITSRDELSRRTYQARGRNTVGKYGGER